MNAYWLQFRDRDVIPLPFFAKVSQIPTDLIQTHAELLRLFRMGREIAYLIFKSKRKGDPNKLPSC